MKLAMFVHRLSTSTPTGIDRYARELIIELAGSGAHSIVAASTHEPDAPDWIPSEVAVRRVPGPRKAVHLAWSLVRRPLIDRVVGDVDLVHVTAPTFPVPTREPLVYTVHDVLPLVHPEWFERVHRWGFREALKDVRDRAAAVIVDSEATATAVESVAGVERARISVIPLGVARPFTEPIAPADVERVTRKLGIERKAYVLYVGQVNERKNVSVVVDALARLGAERPTLVVAGPDEKGAERVRAQVDRLDLASSVRFAGFVPDRDLPALVAGARALVHPSLHEGFGLPPLEAMCAGVPAIVAESAALPDAVGDAALVAPADDAEAWAVAIASLHDPDEASTRGAIGQAHARRFTWARTADATVEVYERVVKDTASG